MTCGYGVSQRALTCVVAALGLLLFPLAGDAAGQVGGTASIVGQVTDESKALLPGVTVTATSPALQSPQVTTITDERGEYRLTPLPIGDLRRRVFARRLPDGPPRGRPPGGRLHRQDRHRDGRRSARGDHHRVRVRRPSSTSRRRASRRTVTKAVLENIPTAATATRPAGARARRPRQHRRRRQHQQLDAQLQQLRHAGRIVAGGRRRLDEDAEHQRQRQLPRFQHDRSRRRSRRWGTTRRCRPRRGDQHHRQERRQSTTAGAVLRRHERQPRERPRERREPHLPGRLHRADRRPDHAEQDLVLRRAIATSGRSATSSTASSQRRAVRAREQEPVPHAEGHLPDDAEPEADRDGLAERAHRHRHQRRRPDPVVEPPQLGRLRRRRQGRMAGR